MRALIQRVKSGKVEINGEVRGKIEKGMVLLLGIQEMDSWQEGSFLVDKTLHLRIFEDEAGKMNRSLLDTGGAVLIVSQFTLYADCQKGRRPSFTKAARPEKALPLYEQFVDAVKSAGIPVETGCFGADMLVTIENDGPVTILLDTDEIMPKKRDSMEMSKYKTE